MLWAHDLYGVDDINVVHTIYIRCCPRHILHGICISCCPRHILHVAHTIYDGCPRHIMLVTTYGVENSWFHCFMPCVHFLYAVGVSILCNMVWTTYMPCVLWCGQHVYIPWVTWVMLWVYGVGTFSSAIWCGLPYAVDDRCPHHIQPVVHGIYMVWVYAVGTHEFYWWMIRI